MQLKVDKMKLKNETDITINPSKLREKMDKKRSLSEYSKFKPKDDEELNLVSSVPPIDKNSRDYGQLHEIVEEEKFKT